jgi:hypothetical protein
LNQAIFLASLATELVGAAAQLGESAAGGREGVVDWQTSFSVPDRMDRNLLKSPDEKRIKLYPCWRFVLIAVGRGCNVSAWRAPKSRNFISGRREDSGTKAAG